MPDYRQDLAYIRNNLGLALMGQNDVKGAIVEFSRAIEIKPDYGEARDNLRNALMKEGGN